MPQLEPANLKTAQPPQKKIVMIYGPPNSHKTRTLATAPVPIILEIEQSGLLSLKGTDVLYWDCFAAEPAAVFNNLRVAWAWIEKNGPKIGLKTVCIDSVTALLKTSINGIVKGEDTPHQKEYGEANRQVYITLLGFWDKLPYDVVMTCGNRMYSDEENRREYTAPDLTPGLFRDVAGTCTDGLYFTPPPANLKEIQNADGTKTPVTHVAYIGADVRYWTKTRSLLPPIYPNPNLTQLFRRIDGLP